MAKRTNVVEILEQATNLSENIKNNNEIELEMVKKWLSETLEMIKELGIAIDKVEERLEILEEIMEE